MNEPEAAEKSPFRRLLDGVAEALSVAMIDELWVFPPRQLGRIETRVLVVSAFDDADPERRRIFTVHHRARRGDRGEVDHESSLDEHGSAPADRVARVVDGVLARVDDELADAVPATFRVAGDPERWLEIGVGHE